jgi:hypothetical protein
MSKWNWTPKAYRLRDEVIFYGCGLAVVGIMGWMFVLATN